MYAPFDEARRLFTFGQYELAIREIETWWTLQPGPPELLGSTLSICYSNQGQWEKGLENAKDTLIHNPLNLLGRFSLVYALFVGKQFEKARSAAMEWPEFLQSEPNHLALMGAICFELGQFSQGLDWINKALLAEPDHILAIKVKVALESALGPPGTLPMNPGIFGGNQLDFNLEGPSTPGVKAGDGFSGSLIELFQMDGQTLVHVRKGPIREMVDRSWKEKPRPFKGPPAVFSTSSEPLFFNPFRWFFEVSYLKRDLDLALMAYSFLGISCFLFFTNLLPFFRVAGIFFGVFGLRFLGPWITRAFALLRKRLDPNGVLHPTTREWVNSIVIFLILLVGIANFGVLLVLPDSVQPRFGAWNVTTFFFIIPASQFGKIENGKEKMKLLSMILIMFGLFLFVTCWFWMMLPVENGDFPLMKNWSLSGVVAWLAIPVLAHYAGRLGPECP